MKIALPLFILTFTLLLSSSVAYGQSATSSATSSATTSSSTSATTTSTSAATTKGGNVTMPEELPATGGFETTAVLLFLGMFAIAIGVYTHYALPLVTEED